MNIIKLKDKVMPGGDQDELIKYFNDFLKGKYAYWVQMRYIVSFDKLSYNGYVRCEEDINRLITREDGTKPYPWGVPYWDFYDERIVDYIDLEETDRINNLETYIIKNKYSAASDVSIDDIKNFRTWLASELLLFDTNSKGYIMNEIFTEKEAHVLQYYKNGMYNNIIEVLNPDNFGGTVASLNKKSVKSCGCCGGTSDFSSLYNNASINVCDPIAIYRKNVYNEMVSMFSDLTFWNRLDVNGEYVFSRDNTEANIGFMNDFKKYIDNIIQTNLPLTKIDTNIELYECNCIPNSTQNNNTAILERLSKALDYIIKDNIESNKNFISKALLDWSSLLYENMQWI